MNMDIIKLIGALIIGSIFARLWLIEPWPQWVKLTWQILGGVFDLAAVVLLILHIEGIL